MGEWERGGARQECDLQRHLAFAGSMLGNERGQGGGGTFPGLMARCSFWNISEVPLYHLCFPLGNANHQPSPATIPMASVLSGVGSASCTPVSAQLCRNR